MMGGSRSSSVAAAGDAGNGILQRKLQRAYQDNELLLSEVQSLKYQVRVAKESADAAMQASITVPPGSNAGAWGELLDQNMRSGTLACLMCMKVHLIKTYAKAFNRWKFIGFRDGYEGDGLRSPKKGKSLSSQGSPATLADDGSRRCQLLKVAQDILSTGSTAAFSVISSPRYSSRGRSLRGTSHSQTALAASRDGLAHFSFHESPQSQLNRSVGTQNRRTPIYEKRSSTGISDEVKNSTPTRVMRYAQATRSSTKMHEFTKHNGPHKRAVKEPHRRSASMSALGRRGGDPGGAGKAANFSSHAASANSFRMKDLELTNPSASWGSSLRS